MSGKKTKVHKKVDGRLLQMNKTFQNLKMKQRDKITGWVYEAYKNYVTQNERIPDTAADVQIIGSVLDNIGKAGIWIPDGEIVSYYHRKKPHLQKRLENEKQQKFRSYVSYYRSIIDQDRCPVVICDLESNIIYMNPAGAAHYDGWGGEKLIGKSLLDCHNPESRENLREGGKLIGYYEKHEYRNPEAMKPYDLWQGEAAMALGKGGLCDPSVREMVYR